MNGFRAVLNSMMSYLKAKPAKSGIGRSFASITVQSRGPEPGVSFKRSARQRKSAASG